MIYITEKINGLVYTKDSRIFNNHSKRNTRFKGNNPVKVQIDLR